MMITKENLYAFNINMFRIMHKMSVSVTKLL